MRFSFHNLSLSTVFQFRKTIKRDPVQHHRVSNPYHAVSIVFSRSNSPERGLRLGPAACAAARASAGKRFLSTEAPVLPLAKCDAATCDCSYQHHADRREVARREEDIGISGRYWTGAERRSTRGRRVND